jgi:hypothetical protein
MDATHVQSTIDKCTLLKPCHTVGSKTIAMFEGFVVGGGVALGGVGMALRAGGIGESTPSWLPNKLLIT